ncbi:hypothetical protein CYMTET_36565 [Cymbomonas tetramitiformis]|uniref:Uncharacterized protein n=1 Tax=Cymbomonas tetramitiformis TaxID=36881 RepID=A0AAE0F7T6_9CHLO|nr:hypothetical protein CYMTET_36565 [Cymbomonas tetramitiformis]
MDLSQIYEGLWKQTVEAVDKGEWPKSGTLVKHCVRTEASSLAPTRFEQDGVLGLHAILCSEDQVSILKEGKNIFEDFVDSCAACMSTQRALEFKNLVFWGGAWHATVCIFSENPTLLGEDERSVWHSIDEDKVHMLRTALEEGLCTDHELEVVVTLHGFRVCADGGLIAVFVEDAAQSFTALRASAKELGTRAIGPLNSRPKKLIHVTLGRILELPSGLPDNERVELFKVVRKWATALGNGTRPADGDSTGCEMAGVLAAPLKIRDVSLCRESGWWMTEYHVYQTLRLCDPTAQEA